MLEAFGTQANTLFEGPTEIICSCNGGKTYCRRWIDSDYFNWQQL